MNTCFFFHKWTPWKQYTEEGSYTPVGLIYPASIRGKSFDYSKEVQARHCKRCGKKEKQDVAN